MLDGGFSFSYKKLGSLTTRDTSKNHRETNVLVTKMKTSHGVSHISSKHTLLLFVRQSVHHNSAVLAFSVNFL